jgi:hypothetical protein
MPRKLKQYIDIVAKKSFLRMPAIEPRSLSNRLFSSDSHCNSFINILLLLYKYFLWMQPIILIKHFPIENLFCHRLLFRGRRTHSI